MKPTVRVFQDDTELVQEVKKEKENGISADNLYVMSHDDDRTDRVAQRANASEISLGHEGLFKDAKNVFRKKGNELTCQI